jgi:formate dehydrogenase major subunit
VYVEGDRVTQIEGDPDSPISRGRLCPKGSATLQLTTGPSRRDRCLHRAPGATHWEPIALDEALDRVADRIIETRRRT